MTKNTKFTASVLAAVLSWSITVGSMPAAALPHMTSNDGAASGIHPVDWRRGGPGLRWFGPGPGIALLGGVIVGGALVATAIAERRASAADLRRCARDYPDFDRRSGTYVDRRGEVRVCPYLY